MTGVQTCALPIYMLGHKTSLHKFKWTEFISSIFSKNTFYYRKKRLHALYDNVPALSFIEVDRSIFGENNTATENKAESGRKAKTASGMVCEAAEKPAEDNCSSAVDASIPVHAYAEAVAALQVLLNTSEHRVHIEIGRAHV